MGTQIHQGGTYKGGGGLLGGCQPLNTMPREWQIANTTNPNRLPKSSIANTILLASIGCTMVVMHECRHSCLGGGNRFCTCHINDSFCPMHSLPTPTTYHIVLVCYMHSGHTQGYGQPYHAVAKHSHTCHIGICFCLN